MSSRWCMFNMCKQLCIYQVVNVYALLIWLLMVIIVYVIHLLFLLIMFVNVLLLIHSLAILVFVLLRLPSIRINVIAVIYSIVRCVSRMVFVLLVWLVLHHRQMGTNVYVLITHSLLLTLLVLAPPKPPSTTTTATPAQCPNAANAKPTTSAQPAHPHSSQTQPQTPACARQHS